MNIYRKSAYIMSSTVAGHDSLRRIHSHVIRLFVSKGRHLAAGERAC